MAKNKILNIDLEFEGLEDFFDESKIKHRTGLLNYWKTNQGLEQRKENSKNSKKSNSIIYGNQTYVLRSPGNDLLDFYDKKNLELGPDNRQYSKVPPSVVFEYRFRHKYPKELFDKSKNYGIFAYLRDQLKRYHKTNDHTYWSQVYKNRYDWLVDEPHNEYRFKHKSELMNFLKEQTGQKAISDKIAHNTNTGNIKEECLETMFWRGKLKGWSIVIEK